jgi:hypothetical protein
LDSLSRRSCLKGFATTALPIATGISHIRGRGRWAHGWTCTVAEAMEESSRRGVTQAWFQGLNPQLEDWSPARLLRDGELDEVGPAVLAAARAFLVGG